MRRAIRLLTIGLALMTTSPVLAGEGKATTSGKPPAAAVRGERVDAWESLPGVEQHLDLVYTRHGDREMRLDLFTPETVKGTAPALCVVHGGGWLRGDKTKLRPLAQALAARGYVTAAIEYRLGGEARFPAAIRDCNAAVGWLRANCRKYRIDPERIGAVGGSAGGHLVGLMATAPNLQDFQGKEGADPQSSRLQAAVVLAGPFELATGPVADRSRNEPERSNANKWFGKTVDEAPALYARASPFTHLSAKKPPILFMAGEYDDPQRNRASRTKLRDLDVATGIKVYADGRHGCWSRRPWFEPMVDDIDEFFASALNHADDSRVLSRTITKWGEMRQRPSGLEIEVRRPPTDAVITIRRLDNPIGAVYLKEDPMKKPLKFSPGIAKWTITLPESARKSGGTIVVETVGRPYVSAIPRVTTADADGSVTLAAHDAITHGKMLRYEPQPHKNTVGYWVNEDDWCEWRFYVEKAGRFDVHVLQGCGKGQGGSEVAVLVADQSVPFTVEDTGHFQNFKDRKVGVVSLPKAGVFTLRLRPLSKAAKAIMDVRRVRLAPATIKD